MLSPWEELVNALQDLGQEFPEFQEQIDATVQQGDEIYGEIEAEIIKIADHLDESPTN